jgi:hypothetical protein
MFFFVTAMTVSDPSRNAATVWNTIRMIKSRRMRWVGQVARMREKGNVYRILVGKSEGKRPLGRPVSHPYRIAGHNCRFLYSNFYVFCQQTRSQTFLD